jgi:hypothetical protein
MWRAMYVFYALALLVLYHVHQHAWQLAYGPCIGSENQWMHLFSLWTNATHSWCENQRQFGVKQMMYVQGIGSSLLTYVLSNAKKNIVHK